VAATLRSDAARLDLRLIAAHPELSRRKAREVIEKGQVTVDGELAREPGAMVDESAAIVWDVNRKAMSRVRLSLPRLYEDETLIVVDKPAGLLSVPSAPGREGEDTARARVFEYAVKLHPRRPYVGAVHRLDRDTSGALAFALTPAAREGLRELFSRHAIVRRYLAIVRVEASGAPLVAAGHGSIVLPISTEYAAGRRRLARPGESSLEARTRYRVRERFHDTALLEIELETGRQHQIRLHLAHVGLPVLGDTVYGSRRGGRGEHGEHGGRGEHAGAPAKRDRESKSNAGAKIAAEVASLRVHRQMLHACLLELTHPLTGVKVRAESRLPADFQAALDRLGGAAQPKKR
jgi:23S rRNA pseudouridine1911/1915/1917 synthase